MDDEKPFDLRDKLAIEILNGLLASGRDQTSTLVADLVHYVIPEPTRGDDPHSKAVRRQDAEDAEYAAKRLERIVRACYKTADIIRKVRLSAFE